MLNSPQIADSDIHPLFLAYNPFSYDLGVGIPPYFLLQPHVDLVNRIDPFLPLFRRRVVFMREVSAEGDVSTGDDVPRVDGDAGRLRLIPHVPSEVVVGIAVAFLQNDRVVGRNRCWGYDWLAGRWEERDGKSR